MALPFLCTEVFGDGLWGHRIIPLSREKFKFAIIEGYKTGLMIPQSID
jgi:hypothetical protein